MSSNTNVNDLFAAAQANGTLSAEGAAVLQVADLGAQIQDGFGMPADDVQASEVLIGTVLIDDSGSIRFAGNAQAMRDGHNEMIAALVGSKEDDSILVGAAYLNGDVLYAYCPVRRAERMDASNYNPMGGTLLYDQTVITLAGAVAKAEEFAKNGVTARSVIVIASDGDDTTSRRNTAEDCRKVIQPLLATELYIIIAMGFGNGTCDFRRIFVEMGIPEDFILTSDDTQSAVRNLWGVASKSMLRASQNAHGFSQIALGGLVD